MGDYVVSEGETGVEVCANKSRETAVAVTVNVNTATSDTAQSKLGGRKRGKEGGREGGSGWVKAN